MPPLLTAQIPFRKPREFQGGVLSLLALPKGNFLSPKPPFGLTQTLPEEKRILLLLAGTTSLLPHLLEAPLLAHVLDDEYSPPQRHGTLLVSHSQNIKGHFSNTHFVGEKVEISVLQHCVLFLQLSPRRSLVVKRLQTSPKGEVSKDVPILKPFLGKFPIFSAIPLLVVVSTPHFLFPESPLPVAYFPSLWRVHTVSGTLSLLALFPPNKLMDLLANASEMLLTSAKECRM